MNTPAEYVELALRRLWEASKYRDDRFLDAARVVMDNAKAINDIFPQPEPMQMPEQMLGSLTDKQNPGAREG